MPPDQGPYDPYEHGFEVTQQRRLDLTGGLGNGHPYGAKPPPRVSWKWLLGLLAVVVLLGIGHSVRHSATLRASCGRLQIAVKETTVRTSAPDLLHWTVTGPAGTGYVVALDRKGSDQPVRATPVRRMPPACLDTGGIGVLAPAGRYDVVLLRVDGTTQTRVATTHVVVTS